jgi:hypothetical protein
MSRVAGRNCRASRCHAALPAATVDRAAGSKSKSRLGTRDDSDPRTGGSRPHPGPALRLRRRRRRRGGEDALQRSRERGRPLLLRHVAGPGDRRQPGGGQGIAHPPPVRHRHQPVGLGPQRVNRRRDGVEPPVQKVRGHRGGRRGHPRDRPGLRVPDDVVEHEPGERPPRAVPEFGEHARGLGPVPRQRDRSAEATRAQAPAWSPAHSRFAARSRRRRRARPMGSARSCRGRPAP